MAENKTQKTKESVSDFIKKIADEQMRKDCTALKKVMEASTGAKAKMWGPSIVGFGDYHYKYDSGREGDFFLAGFSPRKQNLTLYIQGEPENKKALLEKLGKYKAGGSCIYVKKLEDIDLKVLDKMIRDGMKFLKKKYPDTPAKKK